MVCYLLSANGDEDNTLTVEFANRTRPSQATIPEDIKRWEIGKFWSPSKVPPI
jgi:hypothetical protein